jgi:hypothetical protein
MQYSLCCVSKLMCQAIVQAIRRWLLRVEPWVPSQATSCQIHEGQSATGAGSS